MDNEKVSVIIPAYNSEETLERAVSSALSQSYGNVEIIIVDDGSFDRTGEIADRLCSEHESIRVIHKNNEGGSAARNDGIRACCGEWFITLDADDYIDSMMVEKLHKDVSLYETDVSICGFKLVSENGRKEIRRAEEDFQGTLEEFLNLVFTELYDKQLIHTHSNKLYKTSIVRENKLYYKKGISINEDILFSLRYLRHCESVSVVREAYLNYVQHGEGESLVTKYNANGLETCFDVLRACDELLDSRNVEDEVVNAMNNRMFFHICGFAGMPYYKTDYSDERKLEIIKELCAREDFRKLISQTDPKGLKNTIAWILLKNKKAGLYHRLCKLLYRGGVYRAKRPAELPCDEELPDLSEEPGSNTEVETGEAFSEPEAAADSMAEPEVKECADRAESEAPPAPEEVAEPFEEEPEEIEQDVEAEEVEAQDPKDEPKEEGEPCREEEASEEELLPEIEKVIREAEGEAIREPASVPEPEPAFGDKSEQKPETKEAPHEKEPAATGKKPHHRRRRPVIREIDPEHYEEDKKKEEEEYRQIELSDLFDL